MSVDLANAFGVSADSANAVVQERNRCIRLRRQQVQIPEVFSLIFGRCPSYCADQKRHTVWHFVCHIDGLQHPPYVDVGQRCVVLRLVSRAGSEFVL
jgi:hypothetical protein